MQETKRKTVTEFIAEEDIESWDNNDVITIVAGTGVGKSYFIKNTLYEYAKKTDAKILMLLHRKYPVEQFKMELEAKGKSNIIHVVTYQAIEHCKKREIQGIGKAFDFSRYKYIVSDEFHYFCNDSSFNNKTDYSFYSIMKSNAVKIFMSATPEEVENVFLKYVKSKKIEQPKRYSISENYNHIKTLSFFNNYDEIEELIKQFQDDEKAIVFINNCEEAYKLHKKVKDSLFLCSESNKNYYKYVDKEKIRTMLKNERFNEKALICTSCFDAGANIVDEKVTKIICDNRDIVSLIQCLGRKRIINENDKIDVYIKNINNNQLGGNIKKLNDSLEHAEYLNKYKTSKYIKQYGKDITKGYGIIYDETDENGSVFKRINWLMYYKRTYDIRTYEKMLELGKYGYCKYLARKFGFYDEEKNKYLYNIVNQNFTVTSYLKKLCDDETLMYTNSDKSKLIEKLNVKKNGRLVKSINVLNECLKEDNIPYRIIEKNIRLNKIRYRHTWQIVKDE